MPLTEPLPTLYDRTWESGIARLLAAASGDMGTFQEKPTDWAGWLRTCFPAFFSSEFAAHHEEFWEYVWAIKPEVRPKPFIAVWPRGGGKSSSAEVSTIALGVHGARKYALYVCHAEGTPIFDHNRPELGWIPIEQHPTAGAFQAEGLTVSLAGLPMVSLQETVTPIHPYWARRVATRQVKGQGQDTRYGSPQWIEARYLDWNTWIGYPIDATVLTDDEYPLLPIWNGRAMVACPYPRFRDPAFWWVVGLWWGDGTLGGSRCSQISFSCSDDHLDTREYLIKLLERFGYDPTLRPAPSGARCADVIICDSVLGRWLFTWKRGRNRKEPPPWIERLPFDCQRELILGYLAADGNPDDRGAHLKSIHLPGLLSVRRMLTRLGTVSTLGSARTPPKYMSIAGRTYATSRSYILRIEHPSGLGLTETIRSRRHELSAVFIRDGYLWSRVVDVKDAGIHRFIPINTEDHTYLTAYGRSHNSGTQDQADKHVESIAGLLESTAFANRYPSFANRKIGKYGHSKGWRRNRLYAEAGFMIDAAGLDSPVRGIKAENVRPDVIIFDDLDNVLDSPATVLKKIKILTRSILPAGSSDVAIIGVQNLIHEGSIFTMLANRQTDFLLNHIMSGPVPAVRDLEYVLSEGKYEIIAGEPSWTGQDLEKCQELLDAIGLTSFLIECQHDVEDTKGGIYEHIEFQHCDWDEMPTLQRIVVWVDPAVTNTDDSDSHGIQADGIGSNGKLYRLFSWEGRTSPEDSLKRAILKAIELKAECVGVETDQGGDTWASTYRLTAQEAGIKNPPSFRSAKAGQGHGPKAHRQAQMVAAYERGEIIHVRGTHTVLERALRRFGVRKPYDLADAGWWSWYDLCNRRRWLPVGT
jgi:hypothetical protein